MWQINEFNKEKTFYWIDKNSVDKKVEYNILSLVCKLIMLLRSTLFIYHHGLASLLHDDIGMLAVSNNIGRRSSKRVMLQTVSTLLKP